MSSTPAKHPVYDLLTGSSTIPYAIIILNQPINIKGLNAVLPSASLLVCADGGGDRFHSYYTSSSLDHNIRLPDAIIGDLDSLSDEASSFYQSKCVNIIHDPDQYSTDFTKCLKYLRKTWNESHGSEARLDVLALGGLGGRVDQGFSQIHHLYMAQNDTCLLYGRLYLLSEQSLSFVLDNNDNEIRVGPLDVSPSGKGVFNENVGIIPVMGPAWINTHGLEWDVQDWETKFGQQLSTSNHLRSETVLVNVRGGRCLFTLELANNLCLSS
jgi:thiamine pyrophosphokinase